MRGLREPRVATVTGGSRPCRLTLYPTSPDPSGTCMTAPIPTAPGEPRRLGSAYVLISLIGTGAQGEVWLGHRVDDAATSLAVKLLRADLLQDPGVVERFVRERATFCLLYTSDAADD